MARDEQGKWISYEEWKRRQVEKGKLATLAPAPTTVPTVSIPTKAQITPKLEAPKPLPARPPEDIAYMADFERRHPALAKVLRGWKTVMERIPGMPGTPWGQKVGEVAGRTLIGAEPPIEGPKLGKAGEITAGLVGGGLAITGALRGLGIPGAAGAIQQAERVAGEAAAKVAPRAAEVVSRLPALARLTGRAALVEAPAWWAYEKAAYPEEHRPELRQLPEYMAQFGVFTGVTGAVAEALPRVIRYLRRPKAVPEAEVKPPEAPAVEVKPPAAEVKPPEVPTAEVKPPEAPPAEELPVKVGERMTARRKRTGKEYTGVVERVYAGKQGQLLADVRLDDGSLKTIPASRKSTEWRVPEAEAPKVEVPEAPKAETPVVVARPTAAPTPVLPPMVTIAREEGGTVAVMFPDWAHVRLFNIWRAPGRELSKAGVEARAELARELGLPRGVGVDEVASQYREAILAAVRGLPADVKYEAPHLTQIWAGAAPRVEAAQVPPAPEVKPETPAATTVKEPWQMTRKEFFQQAEEPIVVKLPHSTRVVRREIITAVPPGSKTNIPEPRLVFIEAGTGMPLDGNYLHRKAVEAALAKGKPVPPEVLRDYPGLAQAYAKPPQAEVAEVPQIQEAPPGLPVSPLTPEQQQQVRTAVREIVTTFERLGTPIRVGRYYQKARGIYKVQPEAIRTKMWGDIVAISHEVGHHLDKLWKLSSIARHRSELVALVKATGVKAKTPADLAREGVAEFVRLAIADPATAQKQAPGMWTVWQDLLNRHPEVANVLEEAGRRIRGLMSANPEERLLSTMSVGEAPTRRRLFQSWNDFLAKMVDELAALDPFRQAAEAKLGRKLEPLEDPMMLAWRARGWQGKAQAFLRYGVRDATGNKVAPGFQEALETATAGLRGTERTARVNEFRAYAYARRLLEIEPRVRILPGEATFGRQQVIADAQATFAKFDGPAFRQAFDMLQQYQEQMLRRTLGESGLYTQEMIDRIIAENQAYLPLHRVFEAMEAGRVRGAGRGYVDIMEAIRKLKGSALPVVDPLESVVKNTYLFTSLAERNKVGAAIANLAEKAEGLGLWAERVMPKRYAVTVNLEEVLARADKQLRQALESIAADLGVDLDQAVTLFRPAVVGSPKENIAIVWRNGQAELWQFHPELYEALKWMDKATLDLAGRLLRYPAAILRAGAVWYNPVFWLRNPLRDQWTAFIYSKYGYIPGVDLVRGVFHVLKRDELYQLYHASGAAQSTLVSFDRNYLQSDLRKLLGQGKFSVLDALQGLSETMELATRIGEFERGLTRLGRTEEGLLRAALAARDITVDFGRAGTWGKSVNRFAAFFNANVQGLDKLIRVFFEDPTGAAFRAVIGVTLPSIALYLVNRKNPNYWALSDYERDMYWHLPLPDGRFVRLPKPFEPGLLFGSFVERILGWVDKQDPAAVEGLAEEMKPFLSNLWQRAAPNPLPTAFSPPIGWIWQEYFARRPVVPIWERTLPPEEQYGPFTSTVGRLVGKALDVPPRWFDEFLRSYVGGVGLFAVDTIDKALEAAGIPAPPARAGIPFLQDFIARPSSSGDPLTQQFYDIVNQVEGKYRAGRTKVERGEVQGLTPDELMAGVQASVLRRQADALSTLRKVQRVAMTSPNLTDEEKRLLWEVLDSAIMNHVRGLFGLPMVWNPPEEVERAKQLLPATVAEYLRRKEALEQASEAVQQLKGR